MWETEIDVTLREFQSLVSANLNWFSGVHHESAESIATAELRLGVSLPQTLKWLLCEHGYSTPCGVASLIDSIDTTSRYRDALGFPKRYVILDDRGDAGVVLLDEGKVLWVGAHEIARLERAEPVEDIDEFADYATWVVRCLEDAREDA
jgi:hypothetical protein